MKDDLYLEVRLNEKDEVVLYHNLETDRDGGWSIIFTPAEAYDFARRLMERADQASINIRERAARERREAAEKTPVNRSDQTLTDGSPVTPDHREINPETGMQKGYVVLSAAERAKGFVRPVRRTYVHVGLPTPKYPLLDLTPEQKERTAGSDYVKYEKFPEGSESGLGKYWTRADIDRINRGCGTTTTMGLVIAETYARDFTFYSHTFCCHCHGHFPVGENGEFIWDDGTKQRVGT